VYQVLWSVPFCCSGFSMRAGFMRAKHLVPEAADNRAVEKVRLATNHIVTHVPEHVELVISGWKIWSLGVPRSTQV
jgi:hypothetical protein